MSPTKVRDATDNLGVEASALLRRLAQLHAEIAAVYQDLAGTAGQTPEPEDRLVGLAEAMVRLGVTRSWLIRPANWRRVGGFKGPDRRVHFPLSALARFASTTQTH